MGFNPAYGKYMKIPENELLSKRFIYIIKNDGINIDYGIDLIQTFDEVYNFIDLAFQYRNLFIAYDRDYKIYAYENFIPNESEDHVIPIYLIIFKNQEFGKNDIIIKHINMLYFKHFACIFKLFNTQLKNTTYFTNSNDTQSIVTFKHNRAVISGIESVLTYANVYNKSCNESYYSYEIDCYGKVLKNDINRILHLDRKIFTKSNKNQFNMKIINSL